MAVLAATLVRLLVTGLFRRYRFFALFLVVSAARSLFLMQYAVREEGYTRIWLRTEPLSWLVFLLLTWEVHGISTAQYPGMRDFGRKLLIGLSILAVIGSALSVHIDFAAQPERWPVVALISVIRRSLTTTLFFFLALETLFFAFFPIPTQRNALVHQRMATLYFFCSTIAGLFFNLVGTPDITPAINVGSLAVSGAVMLAWGLLLSKAGEVAPAYRQRTYEESMHWKKKSEELELAVKNWTSPRFR